MTKGYANSAGTDWDDLFDPDIVGDGPVADGYDGIKYAALKYGTQGPNTGYALANNADVASLWAKKGSAVYTIAGLDGNQFLTVDQAKTSQGKVYATLSLSLLNDGTWYVSGATSQGNAVDHGSPTSGTWLTGSGTPGNYQVQFDISVSGDGAESGNSAPTWESLSATQSVSVTLTDFSAANSTFRDGSGTVRVRIRNSSGSVISDSSLVLRVQTYGYV